MKKFPLWSMQKHLKLRPELRKYSELELISRPQKFDVARAHVRDLFKRNLSKTKPVTTEDT